MKTEGRKTLYNQIVDGDLTEKEFKEVRLEIKSRVAERIRLETTAALKERLNHIGLCAECVRKIREAL